jgi:fermentation-respiration switch protein FrsA (DUF1100 family)
MQRKEVTFSSGTDTSAAWLYAPAGSRPEGSVPLIVMAHGVTGTRRDRLGPFAERFADAGVAALVFDHRGFGTAPGSPTTSTRRCSWRTGARRLHTPAPCPVSTPAGSRRSPHRLRHLAQSVRRTPSRGRARRSPPADALPRGTVRTYAGVGHFDIYDGPEHEAAVTDEVGFLRRYLFASG